MDGLTANSKSAATPNELRAELSLFTARHTATMENMIRVRVIDTGVPMAMAYIHNTLMTSNSLSHSSFRKRKAGSSTYSIQHIIPTCSPETASTWLTPDVEYTSLSWSLRAFFSPSETADTTARALPSSPHSRYFRITLRLNRTARVRMLPTERTGTIRQSLVLTRNVPDIPWLSR